MKIFTLFLFIVAVYCVSFNQNKQMSKETLQVKKDSVFMISLQASFGEGYSWRLTEISDSSIVKFVNTSHSAGAEDKDGRPETQLFSFKGERKDSCTLQFVYEQPWLKEKSPKLQYKTFLIIIN